MKADNAFREWLSKKGKKIITKSKYMTLATADKHGTPWAAPIAFDLDSAFNFYFVSHVDSLHMRHIRKNPRVAIAIFDSRLKGLKTDAVQMSGIAKIISSKRELHKAVNLYNVAGHTNVYPTAERFLPGSEMRFVRVKVINAYTLNTKVRDKDERNRLRFRLTG